MDFTDAKVRWTTVRITRIEDLRDGVLGADLEATQMSTGVLSGTLAFAQRRGVIYSSGYIGAAVALSGPLSLDKVTLGVALDFAPGSWHWMNEVETGEIGVWLPGDEHDSRYTPGSLYVGLSIDADQLEQDVAREELVLDRKTLGGTGFHARHLPEAVITDLRRHFRLIHAGQAPAGVWSAEVCEMLLGAAINHFGRLPFCLRQRAQNAHARVVRLARAYILEHLSEPISLDDIVTAAFASRRTLYRAFADILNDTPQNFVRRLRLHRIRHDLASDAERACTIALVANQWGISELGRMSGWYRQLFGERPSETLAHAHEAERSSHST